MWKAIKHMSLSEVADAQRVNERALGQLREKRSAGGKSPGSTLAAIERRRTMAVDLADRRRELI